MFVLWKNIDASQPAMKAINTLWINYYNKTVAKSWNNTAESNATFDILSQAVWKVYQRNTNESKKEKLAYLYQLINKRSQNSASNSHTTDTVKETTQTTTAKPQSETVVASNNTFPFICESREWFEPNQEIYYDEMGDAWDAYLAGGQQKSLSERFEISNGVIKVPYNDFTEEGWETVSASHPHVAMMKEIVWKKEYKYLTVQKVNNSVIIFADWDYSLNDLYINGVLQNDLTMFDVSNEQLILTKGAVWSIYKVEWTDLIINTKYETKRDPDMLTKVLGTDMGELTCQIK